MKTAVHLRTTAPLETTSQPYRLERWIAALLSLLFFLPFVTSL